MPLETATTADIEAITDVYMRAFQDRIALACFPRTPSVRAWWEANNGEAIRSDDTARFVKITDDGKIIAYAKWIVSSRSGAEVTAMGGDEPDALPEWPEGSDKNLCDQFFRALANKRKKIMAERESALLALPDKEMLATLPEHQGKEGAASQLIRWGLAQADGDGSEAYIEASPEGAAVYEHFGWRVEGEVVALDGPKEWIWPTVM